MVDEKIKEVEEIKKRINLEMQNNKERFSKENIKLKSSSDSQERFYLEESLRQINPKINITIEVLKDINVNYLNQKNKDLILLEKLKRKKELIEKRNEFELINDTICQINKKQEKLERKRRLLQKRF